MLLAGIFLVVGLYQEHSSCRTSLLKRKGKTTEVLYNKNFYPFGRIETNRGWLSRQFFFCSALKDKGKVDRISYVFTRTFKCIKYQYLCETLGISCFVRGRVLTFHFYFIFKWVANVEVVSKLQKLCLCTLLACFLTFSMSRTELDSDVLPGSRNTNL